MAVAPALATGLILHRFIDIARHDVNVVGVAPNSPFEPSIIMTKQRSIPPVSEYMSAAPLTIDGDRTMSQAHALMLHRQIRHLPVMSAHKLVGVITLGDLHLVEAIGSVDPTRVRVDAVMTQDVYAVSPVTPVDEVVREMARQKYGSTVVVDDGKVVGVFTVVDVCRAFADLLRQD
jgi:acetoin utilization protein AcuB